MLTTYYLPKLSYFYIRTFLQLDSSKISLAIKGLILGTGILWYYGTLEVQVNFGTMEH